MSSFRRSRTGVVAPTWGTAVHLARLYAWQLNLRHRVRGVAVPGGWAWKVERSKGRIREESHP